jgi:hypothetical protein
MPDGVQIDADQVRDFGQRMRTQADSGLASAAGRGTELHRRGVVFGASIPGAAVLDAKTRYAQALEATDANLRAYQRAAVIFAEVAEGIARDFASADLASARGQRRVEQLMQGAITRADAAAGGAGDDGTGGGWA